MTSTGISRYWLPPDEVFEDASPPYSPTASVHQRHSSSPRTSAPPTPIAAHFPRNNPPTRTQPVTSRPTGREGAEYNRREAKFESLFNSWANEISVLEEAHRIAHTKSLNPQESKRAKEEFQQKAAEVFRRYNEQLEALQMSSSEPGSSQSESEGDEDPEEERDIEHEEPDEDDDDEVEREEDEEDEDDEDDDEDDEDDEDDPGEDSEQTEEDDTSENAAAWNRRNRHTDDETDRESLRGYQSSEGDIVAPDTPPPTEEDEDHRAASRRWTRERRKADDIASQLPQRLRSSTIRASAVNSRPSVLSMFSDLPSRVPIQTFESAYAHPPAPPPPPPPRASLSASTQSVESDSSTNEPTSRIEILKKQSARRAPRSKSRGRVHSPTTQSRIFKEQYAGWMNAVQSRSDEVHRKVERQEEEGRLLFERQQEEQARRAQNIQLEQQVKMYREIEERRHRAGSTGSLGGAPIPIPSLNPRPSIAGLSMSALPNGTPSSSVSPTIPRSQAPPPPTAPRPSLQPRQSQTFLHAQALSQSPPKHSHMSSRSNQSHWVPTPTHLSSAHYPNSHSIPSSSSSDEADAENGPDDDESDRPPMYASRVTAPVAIPGSARGSFDSSGRRGPQHGPIPQMSSTPRGGAYPPHLRSQSSVTFSNGTTSARSSGGWSGVSGTSSNTTYISSEAPGSRRGSLGTDNFVPPEGRRSINVPTTASTSPPASQQRWIPSGGKSSSTTGSGHAATPSLSRAATMPVSPTSTTTSNSSGPPNGHVRTNSLQRQQSTPSTTPPTSTMYANYGGSSPGKHSSSRHQTSASASTSAAISSSPSRPWKIPTASPPIPTNRPNTVPPPLPLQNRPTSSNSGTSPPINATRPSPTLRTTPSNASFGHSQTPPLHSKPSSSTFHPSSQTTSQTSGSSPLKPAFVPRSKRTTSVDWEERQKEEQRAREREEEQKLRLQQEQLLREVEMERQRVEEEERMHREEQRRQKAQEEQERLARIKLENDRLTEMFLAKERAGQVATNLPKRTSDAWEAYEEKWRNLPAQVSSGNFVLTFNKVPWPVLNPPQSPESITNNTVGNFVLSQWHSGNKSRKERIRESLLRWHPDRFESRWLDKVPEGVEREKVRLGVGNVARSLNELLTKEGTQGVL